MVVVRENPLPADFIAQRLQLPEKGLRFGNTGKGEERDALQGRYKELEYVKEQSKGLKASVDAE